MIHRKRTHKDVTDKRILEIWEEVKEEAKSLYPGYFEECEPELYHDSSYRHLGLCSQSFYKSQGGVNNIRASRCIITISSNLGQDYDQIRETLCHELGHFVAPRENHSHLWKTRADKIGMRWGLEAKRLTNNETFNNARKEIKNDYKYRVYCPECGAEWKYKSNCGIVKSPGRYCCGKCQTSLKSEKI